ncbi:DUF1294 domain-containing protein [Ottowia thiooxydans]|uniref:DUF1294 domain-containing protein n=1 Tax=Ottowia thiooxydans TaxID=219182 RepID=UPI00041DF4F0|nr:cold shock and DUF1294 domain-containing protein [Ottowia thiooxydans]
MHFDGTIKSWNDERGFGFIEADQGGQEVFVHIKAFRDLRERPQVNQRVRFQVELGPQGKKRALKVEPLRTRRAAPVPVRKNGSAQWGTASLFALPLFAIVLLLGYFLGHPPRWVPGVYLLASVTTFVAYALDKSAAKRGSWRTSEQTLHLLSLVGGWPGALIAQQVLRHKSSKAEFRAVFWVSVVLNIAGFIFLASPYASSLNLG